MNKNAATKLRIKLIIPFIFLVLIQNFASAQATTGIVFSQNSWAETLNEAQRQQKNIFVAVITTSSSPSIKMDSAVFRAAAVGDYFNANFINYRLDAEQEMNFGFLEKYIVDAYPSFLFLRPNGDIIYRNAGLMSAENLILEAEKSINIAKTEKTLAELEALYHSGKREPNFIKNYLLRKVEASPRSNNTSLLDEYLGLIPASEYLTEKTLALIAHCGTTIDSKAFEILLTANERHSRLTPQQNKAMLTGIAKAQRRNIQQAIDTKDETLLNKSLVIAQISAFNPANAEKEIRQIRMKYAKATHNIELYKRDALPFANFLMLKRNETLAQESLRGIELSKNNYKRANKDTTSQAYQNMIMIMTNGAAKATAYQLNEIATSFVELSTDKKYLEAALQWSDRALELNDFPADFYDTNAQILYRLGKKRAAIKQEKKAVAIAKTLDFNIAYFVERLKKMRE